MKKPENYYLVCRTCRTRLAQPLTSQDAGQQLRPTKEDRWPRVFVFLGQHRGHKLRFVRR